MNLENAVSLITSVSSVSVSVCVGAAMSWPLVQAVTPPPSPKHSWHRLVRHSTLNSNELQKKIDGGVEGCLSFVCQDWGFFFQLLGSLLLARAVVWRLGVSNFAPKSRASQLKSGRSDPTGLYNGMIQDSGGFRR